jgi:hypothetical protein
VSTLCRSATLRSRVLLVVCRKTGLDERLWLVPGLLAHALNPEVLSGSPQFGAFATLVCFEFSEARAGLHSNAKASQQSILGRRRSPIISDSVACLRLRRSLTYSGPKAKFRPPPQLVLDSPDLPNIIFSMPYEGGLTSRPGKFSSGLHFVGEARARNHLCGTSRSVGRVQQLPVGTSTRRRAFAPGTLPA